MWSPTREDRTDSPRTTDRSSTDDSRPRSRRRVLAATGGAALAVLAGCSGSGGGESATPTPTTDGDASTSGSTPTSTGTASPTATDPGTGTPREIARTLVERLHAGEYGAAAEPFGTDLASKLPPKALRSTWETQVWSIGGYDRIESVEGQRSDGTHELTVTVAGNYGSLGVDVTVSDGAVTGLYFSLQSEGSYSPPAYATRSAFDEESVTVDAGADCPLPGKVTVPADRGGPVPGVVLVHGSGPQDMNQSIGPQQPFKDLAWGLATRGVAVLRYRKRTAECSAPPERLTPGWIAVEDARTGVEMLRDHEAVRADGVGVVGHSLGGYLAPMIADRSGTVAGIASLSGPGRSLWRSNIYQFRQVKAFDGTLSDAEKARIQRLEQVGKRIDENGFTASRRVFAQTGAFWNAVTDYDPVAVASDLGLPTFVAYGGRDVQVPPESFEAWREGLSGSEGARLRTYPDLNHLLLPGSGPSYVGRYYTEPDNVSKALVWDLSAWAGDHLAG